MINGIIYVSEDDPIIEKPEMGMTYFNTSDCKIYTYTGTEWVEIAGMGNIRISDTNDILDTKPKTDHFDEDLFKL